MRIALEAGRCIRCDEDIEFDPFFAGLKCKVLSDFLHENIQIEFDLLQIQLARLDPGIIQHILY